MRHTEVAGSSGRSAGPPKLYEKLVTRAIVAMAISAVFTGECEACMYHHTCVFSGRNYTVAIAVVAYQLQLQCKCKCC
jgi:hypothetical protein